MTIKPVRPKGPALNAMRAFEAAARLESFVAAADELSVTPGAISQHIKTIEAWAGIELFKRHTHGVSLTAHGNQLVSVFTTAFDHLAAATHSLRNLQPNGDIHIAALPAIAQLWLPSRLEQLRNAFPQLNFSVTALETPPTLSREMFDLSIFFEEPNDNSDQIVLAHDIIFPVCAPKLAEGFTMGSARLLHDQGWSSDWRLWAEQTGSEMDALNAGARYSLYGLAVEEAKAGAGILMGHACLIDSLLKTGQLVPASLKQAKTGRAMVLNLPNSPTRRPVVDNIAAHLVDQIGSTN